MKFLSNCLVPELRLQTRFCFSTSESFHKLWMEDLWVSPRGHQEFGPLNSDVNWSMKASKLTPPWGTAAHKTSVRLHEAIASPLHSRIVGDISCLAAADQWATHSHRQIPLMRELWCKDTDIEWPHSGVWSDPETSHDSRFHSCNKSMAEILLYLKSTFP